MGGSALAWEGAPVVPRDEEDRAQPAPRGPGGGRACGGLRGHPEQESVARNVAAILMARQIRQAGRIHPQTILTEIGALAGLAAQMSIRKSVIEAQQLDPEVPAAI